MTRKTLSGTRWEIARKSTWYPPSFENLSRPPDKLYLVGDPACLVEGLAVIGARRATPYGRTCAHRFSLLAAQQGIIIVSGGALGCDSAAHGAALEAHGRTVVFLGGGCDRLYPAANASLFQRVIDTGGAIVSEHPWERDPRPFAFRSRNRLIAALSKAVLIVEAGLPSGTFSTADEALSLGKEVLVVPGAITSQTSRGSNRLLFQGATPVVDDETFSDVLGRLFNTMCGAVVEKVAGVQSEDEAQLLEAIRAQPIDVEALYALVASGSPKDDARGWMMEKLAEFEAAGLVARYLDGRWGPP